MPVREFTNEPSSSKNGKTNSKVMREMWDYEDNMVGVGKRKRDSNSTQRESYEPQSPTTLNCDLCGGNHDTMGCPHESRFSQMGEGPSRVNMHNNLLGRKTKQAMHRRPPPPWRPDKPKDK